MCIKHEKAIAENLRRWRQSGQAWDWVVAHQGSWNHQDWLKLLAELQGTQFWPMVPAEVGRVLEEMKVCYTNLKRWKESGHPAWWVQTRNGAWSNGDWNALMDLLRRSEYWPLFPPAVEEMMAELKERYENLTRWQESGAPLQWVEDCRGEWNHQDWLNLLAELQQSEFWPMTPEDVGRVLEELKAQYKNLQRWQASGEPRLWVETRGRLWSHGDWTELLAQLETSEFWPINPIMVGNLLEQIKNEVHADWDQFETAEPVWGTSEVVEDFLLLRFPVSYREQESRHESDVPAGPAPASIIPLPRSVRAWAA